MPKEVLSTIKEVGSAAKEALAVLKTAKQAMSVNMDISMAPLMAKRALLDAAISEVRAKTKVIPQDLIAQCPQVGAINTLLESSLVGALEGVENMVFDIDRLQSQKLVIVAEISQIDTAIDFFTQISECIDEVIAST